MTERIVYTLNNMRLLIEDISMQLHKQDNYKDAIRTGIRYLQEAQNDTFNKNNAKIRITYDNPNGVNYILTTYDNIMFEGKNIIIKTEENNKITIVNHNFIKKIDITI